MILINTAQATPQTITYLIMPIASCMWFGSPIQNITSWNQCTFKIYLYWGINEYLIQGNVEVWGLHEVHEKSQTSLRRCQECSSHPAYQLETKTTWVHNIQYMQVLQGAGVHTVRPRRDVSHHQIRTNMTLIKWTLLKRALALYLLRFLKNFKIPNFGLN